jgi:selenocysteine-specific elongation factor
MASNIVIKSIFKMVESDVNPSKLLNINIGVLGHIDSGKTSLCKALSTIASTAGFDKSPQSKERGITLDLGFSAFVVPVP